ncbi:MAG: hypothetical protein JNK48_22925 [Bryobacterales bacterium]|nr:hypothetical protein [Bryobacterales bacterium]
MDIIKAIEELRNQKARLDEVIARLEALTLKRSGQDVTVPVKGRRGRKYMDPKEREIVSQRMKEYWAKRRKAAGKAARAAAAGG